MQNLVVLCYSIWTYSVVHPKILALRPTPLDWECDRPLKTCYFARWIAIPSLVALG